MGKEEEMRNEKVFQTCIEIDQSVSYRGAELIFWALSVLFNKNHLQHSRHLQFDRVYSKNKNK